MKRVFPSEISDAVLFVKEREEKEREMDESEERDVRSRYIPPPLFAEHEENEV